MATKDYSSKQEHLVADILGWQVVSGSGAAAGHPGDIIGEEWLGECKTHTGSGHKIFFSKSVWDKIKQEAMVKHRFPVLITDDGSQKATNTWCLCMRDRLENAISIHQPLNITIRTNISFLGDDMTSSAKHIVRLNPGMNPVFDATWGEDEISICQLSVFSELLRE